MPDFKEGPPAAEEKTWLERTLSLVADVRPGEAGTALLLAVNGFLILTAYYVVRPVRSALLLPVSISLPGGGVVAGPEITSYSGAVLAGLFLFIVPLYGALASKVNRVRLINGVTLFFVSNLVLFFFMGLGQAPAALLGITFFLWVGIFNLMVIAQFWSFANDVYTPEEGKRLFAIVGLGASVGAIAGALITGMLIRSLGAFPLMLVSAGILLVCLALTNVIHVREKNRVAAGGRRIAAEQPLGKEGGFRLVLSDRYLLLIGLLTLAVQLVNTNGNYILNATLTNMARTAVAAGASGGLTESQIIGSFQAGIDFWQNVLVVLIQFFLVSRIFKYLGTSGALFILPMLALGSYGLFAAAPVLALIRVAKIAENATDYSLQNTLRRALFLPTSREAKYKALNAVETFFWRAGDMLSGLATFVIVQMLALGVRSYALVNLGIVVVWIVIAVGLARENRRLMAETRPAAVA
jgi:AAA family ATP:ADP antiporter